MKRIEVVAAVIVRDGEILATRRGYGEWQGWWEFPGGKMEAGESPRDALRREIREELDAEIEVGSCLLRFLRPVLRGFRASARPWDSLPPPSSLRETPTIPATLRIPSEWQGSLRPLRLPPQQLQFSSCSSPCLFTKVVNHTQKSLSE